MSRVHGFKTEDDDFASDHPQDAENKALEVQNGGHGYPVISNL